MDFIEYELTSDALCMGERVKAGLLKPCARTVRYSQITGALKKIFGNINLHAVGYLIGDSSYNIPSYLTYSPRDRSLHLSKLPLQVEFLENVLGRVFLLKNEDTKEFPDLFEIQMGALLSKGFGKCILKSIGIRDGGDIIGGKDVYDYMLNVRIPEKHASLFNVRNVIRPVWGYLFEPISLTAGVYVRALFEGSVVVAPRFLLKKVR